MATVVNNFRETTFHNSLLVLVLCKWMSLKFLVDIKENDKGCAVRGLGL